MRGCKTINAHKHMVTLQLYQSLVNPSLGDVHRVYSMQDTQDVTLLHNTAQQCSLHALEVCNYPLRDKALTVIIMEVVSGYM